MTIAYNPKEFYPPSNPSTTAGDAYGAIGVISPHYIGALTDGLPAYSEKAAKFSNLNAADRLTGFFLGAYSKTHIEFEIAAVLARAQDKITKDTIAGYLSHTKAIGDSFRLGLGTMRASSEGSDNSVYTNEKFTSCSHYNLTSNTASINTSFRHVSAKHEIKTVSFYNQITDVWQGSSKYVWWRAERHMQFQAATLGVYVSEAFEQNLNVHNENASVKTSKLNSWKIFIKAPSSATGTTPANLEIQVGDKFRIEAKESTLKITERMLIEARDAYIQAKAVYIAATQVLEISSAGKLILNANNTLTVTGSQIFLNTGGSSSSKQTIAPINKSTSGDPKTPKTLPSYKVHPSLQNRKGGVTLMGNQTIQNFNV